MPYSRLERMNIRSSLYSSYRVLIKVGYSLIINNQIINWTPKTGEG